MILDPHKIRVLNGNATQAIHAHAYSFIRTISMHQMYHIIQFTAHHIEQVDNKMGHFVSQQVFTPAWCGVVAPMDYLKMELWSW